MEVLTKAELSKRYPEILIKIKQGSIFIHPTDTIYGLGCSAVNEKAVEKIRQLKQQFHQPLSVWVPNLDWVAKNCLVTENLKDHLRKLPGPYTLIVQLKNKNAIAKNVILGKNNVGIRLPDHWLSKMVEDMSIPIVTTSVNRTGQQFMTSLEDLDKNIESGVDFMIYEGKKEGRPSKILNLVEGTVKER